MPNAHCSKNENVNTLICIVFAFSINFPKLAARWVADDCEAGYDSAAASRGPSRSYVSALLGEVSMSLVDNK